MKIKNKLNIIFIFILINSFFALKTEGAVIYFQPDQGEYFTGDVFLVNVWLDTQGENINAAQVEIDFPPDKLEAINISKGNSIFTFWPEEPIFSNKEGKINFVGGVPLGFIGDEKILTIAFRVIFNENEKNFAEINISSNSQVLLNDGNGTKATLETKKSLFFLSPQKTGEFPKNEWEEELKNDKNPPEKFDISLEKNPLIFEGKYFIAFNTIDRESGVDYYEVKEGKKPWKKGQSPYLLEDQSLSSKILVKAVDKAGNEIISELPPLFPRKPIYKNFLFWLIFVFTVLLLIIVFLAFIYNIRKKD